MMGPKLLCGFACCANLLAAPAAAKDDSRARLLVPAKPVATAPTLTSLPNFRNGIAAIVADKATMPNFVLADVDRSRLVDQFRLSEGSAKGSQSSAAPLPDKVVNLVRRREARGMSFGFDGGSANLGPPVDDAARPAEVVAYHLSETSTCWGLMPGVDCNTIGGDDYNVRLALALDF
jgi:hypothetical protein